MPWVKNVPWSPDGPSQSYPCSSFIVLSVQHQYCPECRRRKTPSRTSTTSLPIRSAKFKMQCLERSLKAAPTTAMCVPSSSISLFNPRLTIQLGRMDRNSRPHDEDPDWPWRALNPGRLRHPRHGSRSHLSNRHCRYHHMVGLHGRCVQAEPS